MQTEPTEEQLRAAYAAIALPAWGSYEQIREGARHWALIRLQASVLARGSPVIANEPAREKASAPPARPGFWGSLRVPKTIAGIDHKRAAAGERDDD